MQRAAPDPILVRREVAAHLRISVRALDDLTASGRGPRHLKLTARRIGFRQSDLDRWLDERAAATAA